MLKPHDKFGLLNFEIKIIHSFDDIFNDDDLGILNDDSEGLFDLKSINIADERASTNFVARRIPCKSFDKYKLLFKGVQKDLKDGKRKLIWFKEENLREGDFYVHNGVLLYLEKVTEKKEVIGYKSGSREEGAEEQEFYLKMELNQICYFVLYTRHYSQMVKQFPRM